MKRITHLLLLCCCPVLALQAQITIPVKRANFEVDGGLRANIFNGTPNSNGDDWFGNGDPGTGTFVIDTTGAGYINQLYLSNPASRMLPLFRGMNYPQFSIVNNAMLIDAVFIRDHHGDDSTAFASGSNKNGMSPASWATPIAQGVPDKNDILDMFMHVRREGPSVTDSLWFVLAAYPWKELVVTGILILKCTRQIFTMNAQALVSKDMDPMLAIRAGSFDAAGHITKAGDIIFTAEYGGSGLNNLEARIWVNKSALLSVAPTAFNWGGDFDGATAGSTFGYANIVSFHSRSFLYRTSMW